MKQFDGNFSPNSLLQNAVYLGKSKITGPESIVFDRDGNLYASLLSGQIVKMDKDNRDIITTFVQIGEETNENICSNKFLKFKTLGKDFWVLAHFGYYHQSWVLVRKKKFWK